MEVDPNEVNLNNSVNYLMRNFYNIVHKAYVLVVPNRQYDDPLLEIIDDVRNVYNYVTDFRESFLGIFHQNWSNVLQLGIRNYDGIQDVFSGISITFYMRVDELDTDSWFLFEERSSYRFSENLTLERWQTIMSNRLLDIKEILNECEESYEDTITSVQRVGYILYFRENVSPSKYIVSNPFRHHVHLQPEEFHLIEEDDKETKMQTRKQRHREIYGEIAKSTNTKKTKSTNNKSIKEGFYGQKHKDKEKYIEFSSEYKKMVMFERTIDSFDKLLENKRKSNFNFAFQKIMDAIASTMLKKKRKKLLVDYNDFNNGDNNDGDNNDGDNNDGGNNGDNNDGGNNGDNNDGGNNGDNNDGGNNDGDNNDGGNNDGDNEDEGNNDNEGNNDEIGENNEGNNEGNEVSENINVNMNENVNLTRQLENNFPDEIMQNTSNNVSSQRISRSIAPVRFIVKKDGNKKSVDKAVSSKALDEDTNLINSKSVKKTDKIKKSILVDNPFSLASTKIVNNPITEISQPSVDLFRQSNTIENVNVDNSQMDVDNLIGDAINNFSLIGNIINPNNDTKKERRDRTVKFKNIENDKKSGFSKFNRRKFSKISKLEVRAKTSRKNDKSANKRGLSLVKPDQVGMEIRRKRENVKDIDKKVAKLSRNFNIDAYNKVYNNFILFRKNLTDLINNNYEIGFFNSPLFDKNLNSDPNNEKIVNLYKEYKKIEKNLFQTSNKIKNIGRFDTNDQDNFENILIKYVKQIDLLKTEITNNLPRLRESFKKIFDAETEIDRQKRIAEQKEIDKEIEKINEEKKRNEEKEIKKRKGFNEALSGLRVLNNSYYTSEVKGKIKDAAALFPQILDLEQKRVDSEKKLFDWSYEINREFNLDDANNFIKAFNLYEKSVESIKELIKKHNEKVKKEKEEAEILEKLKIQKRIADANAILNKSEEITTKQKEEMNNLLADFNIKNKILSEMKLADENKNKLFQDFKLTYLAMIKAMTRNEAPAKWHYLALDEYKIKHDGREYKEIIRDLNKYFSANFSEENEIRDQTSLNNLNRNYLQREVNSRLNLINTTKSVIEVENEIIQLAEIVASSANELQVSSSNIENLTSEINNITSKINDSEKYDIQMENEIERELIPEIEDYDMMTGAEFKSKNEEYKSLKTRLERAEKRMESTNENLKKLNKEREELDNRLAKVTIPEFVKKLPTNEDSFKNYGRSIYSGYGGRSVFYNDGDIKKLSDIDVDKISMDESKISNRFDIRKKRFSDLIKGKVLSEINKERLNIENKNKINVFDDIINEIKNKISFIDNKISIDKNALELHNDNIVKLRNQLSELDDALNTDFKNKKEEYNLKKAKKLEKLEKYTKDREKLLKTARENHLLRNEKEKELEAEKLKQEELKRANDEAARKLKEQKEAKAKIEKEIYDLKFNQKQLEEERKNQEEAIKRYYQERADWRAERKLKKIERKKYISELVKKEQEEYMIKAQQIYDENRGNKAYIDFHYLVERYQTILERLDVLYEKRKSTKNRNKYYDFLNDEIAELEMLRSIYSMRMSESDVIDFDQRHEKWMEHREEVLKKKREKELKNDEKIDVFPTFAEMTAILKSDNPYREFIKAWGIDVNRFDKYYRSREVALGKKRGKDKVLPPEVTKKEKHIESLIKQSLFDKQIKLEDQLGDDEMIERLTNENQKPKVKSTVKDLDFHEEKFGRWVETPSILKNSRVIFNPTQNSKTENKCFIGCTLSHLNKVYKQSEFEKMIRNEMCGTIDSQLVNTVTVMGMVSLEQVEIFAKQNSLKYRIWKVLRYENGAETIINYCIINPKGTRDTIHLLMDGEHFSLIKDPSSFYRKINDKQPDALVCHLCYNVSYYSQELLDRHIELCNTPEIGTFKVIADEEKKKMKFTNHKNKNYKSFVIYADIEAILDHSNQRELSKHQKIISDHIPIALGCFTTNFFSNIHDNKYKEFYGRDCIDGFLDYIECLEIYCANINKENIPKKFVSSRNYVCHLCNSVLSEGYHITGINACLPYDVHVHKHCFEKFYPKREITIIFHNLKGYDAHFIIDKFSARCTNFFSIPRSKEKYTFFSGTIGKSSIKFIDSYAFLQDSLDNIAKNIDKNNLQYISGKEWEKFPKEFIGLKLAFPYEYISSEEVLNEATLPINNDDWKTKIGKIDKDFDKKIEMARELFDRMGCKSIKEYMLMYLKVDVFVLLESFEIFRSDIVRSFDVDPCYYFTTPGLAWDCALNFIQKQDKDFFIEVPTDKKLISFFTQQGTIRGGISTVSTLKVAESNENISIDYYDVTNLYGYAMCKSLPYGGFRFIEFSGEKDADYFLQEKIDTWTEDDEFGYIFEITVSFIAEEHRYYNDLPPFAEHIDGKLIPNLQRKVNYKAHICIIQQAFNMGGIIIEGVATVLEFKQKRWLKNYIEHNTEKRNQTSNKFLKDFWKLMNNSVYGKSMENVLKRKKLKFFSINDESKMIKEYKDFSIRSYDLFTNNLYIAESNEIQTFTKPIYVGFAILEYSKMHMYFLLYKVIKPNLDSCVLMYMDTDSFVIRKTGEFNLGVDLVKKWMDIPGNNITGILGTLKKEFSDKVIKRFYALRSKSYLIKFSNGEINIKNKGCTNASLSEDDFKRVILPSREKINIDKEQYTILSKNHNLYTVCYKKIVLSNKVDNKRVLLENGICTVPLGSSVTKILFDTSFTEVENKYMNDNPSGSELDESYDSIDDTLNNIYH